MARARPAPPLEPSCLYPSERELALLILGKDRAHQWPAFAVVEERHGLPAIDQLFGGRYWPDVSAHLKRRSARATPAPAAQTPSKAWAPKLNEEGVDVATPGMHAHARPSGQIAYYWRPAQKQVRAGCPMKLVRIHGDPHNPVDLRKMAETCQRLQAELLAWTPSASAVKSRFAEGTLGHLCDAYECGADAPIRELRHSTQQSYSRYLKYLTDRAGDQMIGGISGKMIRSWFKEWRTQRGHRDAYGCIQLLRIVTSYGVECAVSKDDPCFFLRNVLERMEFEQPIRRTSRATHELVSAFVKKAAAGGRPSLALALSLQFELGLRQKDVIGEWVPRKQAPGSSVAVGWKAWAWGITWDQIDENWILRKPTSKSNGREVAEHDLGQHPELKAMLEGVPAAERQGPVVREEKTRLPYRREFFSQQFRKIADEAGWPKSVRNMDSRAGAVSEAFEAGADPADVMKAATHKQISTTMSYNRSGLEQTRRVAQLRAGRRRATAAPAGDEERSRDEPDHPG